MRIIGGEYKNRELHVPKGLKTRPTSGRLREALFNICQGEIDEDTLFLDLFAGSGAMGLEALSRGARKATFVDNSRESSRCIHDNIRLLGVENRTEVLYGDVFEIMRKLANQGRSFNIIYADPPYEAVSRTGGVYSLRVVSLIEELAEAGASLLLPGGLLFIEDAAGALKEPRSFKYIELKSMRNMGRSALQHFIYRCHGENK